MEGEGSSEAEHTEIQTNTDTLDNSTIFHIVKDILGFILFMHQQIPSVLQDITVEFDNLKEEYKEMATAQSETTGSIKRRHIKSRMRECRIGIKRFEKLMNTISGFESALQLIISEVPNLHSFLLILGANPIRPQQVYDLSFSHGQVSLLTSDFAKSKAAEALSRKAIRALIAKGAGSSSYPGPTKLFLLVKAPSSFNQPLHFLPKRDFRYHKKIVPVRLRVKCRSQHLQLDACENSSFINSSDSPSNELMWFQCRHVVRGLTFMTPTEE